MELHITFLPNTTLWSKSKPCLPLASSGTPEGQGNTQFNLKGSEGCDGNHQDPLSKDNLVPVRHLPPSIYPSGKRVAHHWGPLFQLLPPRCRHPWPAQSKESLVTVFDSGAESNNGRVGEGNIGPDPQINGEGSVCFFGRNYYICSGVGGDWLCHRPIPTGKWERCGAIRPFYGGE